MGAVEAKKLYEFSEKAMEDQVKVWSQMVFMLKGWAQLYPTRHLGQYKSWLEAQDNIASRPKRFDSGGWCVLMRNLTIHAGEARDMKAAESANC